MEKKKVGLETGYSEVRFVTAVTAGGSVNFFASGVNFSIFTYLFVFLSPKVLKFGEIKGVKFLARKFGKSHIYMTKSHFCPISPL